MRLASRSNGKGPMSLGIRFKPWATSSMTRKGGHAPGEHSSPEGAEPTSRSAPVREEGRLVHGRLPIGAEPPSSLPVGLIHAGMAGTAADILDLTNPSRARAVAVAPIVAPQGGAVGLVVVELSASGLIEEV